MKHILILSAFGVLLFAHSAPAQTNALEHLRAGMPSPEAASLGRFGEIPVSLSTGVPDISIPLHAATGRTMSLPVTLKYHSSGIKVEEVPGWVGLGWAIEAGGVITRLVRDIPDENEMERFTPGFSQGYFGNFVLHGDDQTGTQGLYDVVDAYTSQSPPSVREGCVYDAFELPSYFSGLNNVRREDTGPDLFYFSFAGRSGRFMAGRSNNPGAPLTFRTMPQQNLRFEFQTTSGSEPGAPELGLYYDRYISEWTVTDENGTRYIFSAVEFTTTYSNFAVNPEGSIGSGPDVLQRDRNGHTYASAWHLTRIISPSGADEIVLDYEPYTYSQRHRDRREAMFSLVDCPNPVFDHGDYLKTHSLNQARRLTRIRTGKEVVTFSVDAIPGSDDPFSNNPRYRLSRITVLDPSESFRLAAYAFAYNDTEVANGSRLMLASMQQLGASDADNLIPPYRFEYDPTPLPDRLDMHVDHWGYYNGNTPLGIHSPLPDVTLTMADLGLQGTTVINISGMDKSANSAFTQAGLLRTITYPTGGTSSFEYEANTYSMIGRSMIPLENPDGDGTLNERQAGGVRIKQIVTTDGRGDTTRVAYRYAYEPYLFSGAGTYDTHDMLPYRLWVDFGDQLAGRSTGVVVFEPEYIYHHIGINSCEYVSVSDQSNLPVGVDQNLTYQAVTVIQDTGEGEAREVHVFSTANGYIAVDPLDPDTGMEFSDLQACDYLYNQTGNPSNTGRHSIAPLWDGALHTRYDWLRGLPLATGYFEADELVRKVENRYTFYRGLQKYPVLQVKHFSPSAGNSHAVMLKISDVISSFDFQSRRREWVCADGQCTDIKTTRREYTFQYPFQLRTTEEEITRPDGTLHTRTILKTYAHERYASMDAFGGDFMDPADDHAHMLSQPYATTVMDDDTVVSKQWTCWTNTWGDAFWRQQATWDWTGVGNPETADPCLTGTGAQRTGRITAYSPYGQLLQQEDAMGTPATFYFDPDYRFVESISSQNLTASYAYYLTDHRWGLLERITDENNRQTSYDYDAFRRLTEVRDHSGAPVTQFEYHHTTGDPLADPNTVRIIAPTGINSMISSSYFDGLGRLFEQRSREEEGLDIVSTTEYDALGRLYRTSKPFRSSVSDPTTATAYYQQILGQELYCEDGTGPFVYPYTETLYHPDPLGRPRLTRPAHCGVSGFTTTEYSIEGPFLTTRTTDENGNGIMAYTDGYGQTVKTVSGLSDQPGEKIEATTRFDFDARGNVTAVYPPNYHAPPTGSIPDDWISTFAYNALGQLVEKMTPDIDQPYVYRYDPNGNLRFVQDPNQRTGCPTAYNAAHCFLYTRYDRLNRMVESGIYSGSTAFEDADATNPDWPRPGIDGSTWERRTYSYTGNDLMEVIFENAQAHREGRTLYTYDAQGRIQTYTMCLNREPGENTAEYCKSIHYEYDRQGRITGSVFQPNTGESFSHLYTYDAAGRLHSVYTNLIDDFGDGVTTFGTARKQVEYVYTATGQVKQLLLGSNDSGDPVQTIDYRYHIRDWLTHINDIDQMQESDAFGLDRFALKLSYGVADDDIPDFRPQFNGNVAALSWRTRHDRVVGRVASGADWLPQVADYSGYSFSYDALNRLTLADFSYRDQDTDWNAPYNGVHAANFDISTVTYDLNGNMDSLHRNTYQGDQPDQLTFHYNGSNRLSALDNGNQSHTLAYDANGNMTLGRDDMTMDYTHYNLPRSVSRNGETTSYRYDADGHRFYKENDDGAETYYFRGIDGTVLAVYSKTPGSDLQLQYYNIIAGGSVIGRIEVPDPNDTASP